MEKVQGIGGFFFRARDPKRLAQWYRNCLGLELSPSDQSWHQLEGPTAFQPFPQKTSYFGNPEKTWMLNFRVRDLAAMVRQLRAAGVAVDVDPGVYPYGVFARLTDPEGNPIQLWEPRGPAAAAKTSGRS
jgi:predicted enzyme related to lactoylglutathione lyase